MKKLDPPTTFGAYTIIEQYGFFGLIKAPATVVLKCVFKSMKWINGYLCIQNYEGKWGIIHFSMLERIIPPKCNNVSNKQSQ